MSFLFNCPFCHQSMTCEDTWNGMQSKCPVCGKDILLSNQPVPVPVPSPMPSGNVPGVQAQQPPRQSGLASAALTLGILSIFFPLCGTLAFIMGFIAMILVGKSHGRVGGMGKAVTGFVFGCLAIIRAVVIFYFFLGPGLAKAREKSRTISCVNNEKQILLGAMLFAEDHDGMLPKSLEEMGDTYVDYEVLICPAGGEYRYFGNGQPLGSVPSPSESILIVCSADHGDDIVAVGFADGHVETLDASKVEDAIASCKKGNLPMLNNWNYRGY